MKTDRKKRALLLVLMHILILAFFIWVWRCPVYLLSGIPCMGCGITRAYLSILEGNIAEAFYWNPMFLPAGVVFLYAVHRENFRSGQADALRSYWERWLSPELPGAGCTG